MTDTVTFTLDGEKITAPADKTLWEIVRDRGSELPHLCHRDGPGYRPDGNCRTCVVEVKGERALAASCIRKASDGMVVETRNDRARAARAGVVELLMADQPGPADAHDRGSLLWQWAEILGATESRYPARHPSEVVAPDMSHPAMAVQLDACIHCGLCVRACREVQVNDVIGMSGRGTDTKIVFDLDDPMGESTCVACGECVAACPTGALLPMNLVDEAGRGPVVEADKTVDSLCPYCGVGCQLTYHVHDNQIIKVEGRDGPANMNRLCVKGRFGFDYAHHSDRLTRPLIRKDGVGKRWDDEVDPADPRTHFREASWDEALAFAVEGLAKIRDKSGGKALAGFGSAKGSNEEAYLFQKLIRTAFGTNNVDHCTRLCHASSVAALMETIGSGAVTADFGAAMDADVIMVIGARPTENHPVAATFLKQAVVRGAKLIVIDPRGQALSRYATFDLQFKAGTDVALLNAIMHVIDAEGLVDRQYIQAYTEDYEALAARLPDFSPEKMAPLCGVDADTIREVARLYASAEKSIIFWGMGIAQHVHGTDNARSLISLALMCGHVGRPGTGLHPLRGQNNVQGASDAGLVPMFYPDYKDVGDGLAQFQEYWGVKELDPEPGLTVVEIMQAAGAGEIKGMYIMGENPAMSDPDQIHVRQALANLEHLVVQEIFLTETAFHADVILPASAFPEKSGTFTNTNRQVQLARPALETPGEARQDWLIIQELAQRLGLDWAYGDIGAVYEEMRGCMPSLAAIPWTRLQEEGAVTYPCDSEDAPGHNIIFGDGFPTETGRGRFVPAGLVPPDELPDDEFPLVLTTGRVLEHWHTGAITRRSDILDRLEPEAVACLHPAELDRLGLEPGDRITVSSRRGSVELIARADRDVAQGEVFIPFCYAEAAANILTNPALDPVGKIAEVKYCAAAVEKARPRQAAD
ncbi:MAG: formate dehydrogenase subunit alpha [Alphaproteobacteria bacterium]|nr:formate dehydrogenase subunit alpha [Alphaproteobacteria bacterium]